MSRNPEPAMARLAMLAQVPEESLGPFLQCLREFDAQHPGCVRPVAQHPHVAQAVGGLPAARRQVRPGADRAGRRIDPQQPGVTR